MGTHSKTMIYDEEGKALIAIYRQFDGYFEGHGQDLANILKDLVIVNGHGSHTPKKAANGMGCLAAQIVAHLKAGIGNIYVVPINSEDEEFNYEIRFVPCRAGEKADFTLAGRVSLIGFGVGEEKQFDLYGDLDLSADVKAEITFVYDKEDGSKPTWRTIDMTEEIPTAFKGYEDGVFKCFLKSRIIGGKVMKAN